MQRPTLGEIYL